MNTLFHKSNKLNMIFVFSSLVLLLTSPAMADDLNITIIYDNNPYIEELQTKWGFSCLIEGLDKTILFDVGGDGSILISNMEKLQIDPQEIDIVVLSHIHYDHIGGLDIFLEKNPDVTVYVPISFPQNIKNKVINAGSKLVEVSDSIEICQNAYSSGELGDWIKEQSLIIKTSEGLVIITGCAHPGIVNIVKKAKEMFETDVYLILGGFHLCEMNEYQIKQMINQVKEENVEKVVPCHCSGDSARQLFKETYGENFILSGAGKKIKIANAF